jgi:N utilization substance protein B
VSHPRPVARRHSRRLALQALYAADLALQAAGEGGKVDYGAIFDGVATHFDLATGAREFAKELVMGVAAAREEIDVLVADHARNWRVGRMATVDRNVLRLGVYELLEGEVPHNIVINEAIELARDFGSDRSPAFVNGVLDAVARDVVDAAAPSEGS